MEELKNPQEIEETQTATESKKSVAKRVISIIVTTLEVLLVVFLLVISAFTIGSTRSDSTVPGREPITGLSFFPVLSNSMVPTFDEGDLVVGKAFDESKADQLKVNDIITFRQVDTSNRAFLNTHRIIDIEVATAIVGGTTHYTYTFKTQGDLYNPEYGQAEADADKFEMIPASRIVAVYQNHIANLGTLMVTLQEPVVSFFVIVFPLIILFAWNGFVIIKVVFDNKRKKELALATAANEDEKQRLLEEAKRLALEELRKEQEAELAKQEASTPKAPKRKKSPAKPQDDE